jgi:hypothetical protein
VGGRIGDDWQVIGLGRDFFDKTVLPFKYC